MSKPKLKQLDFCRTAKAIGCEVEAIQAVARVESGGRGGFDEQGRLLLRFEGHHFRKYTNGKYDKSHPHLSYTYSQQKIKPHDYSAFNEAFALDPIAAMLACSYGMYQILGSHYDDMGFDSVGEFVDFLKQGEAAHLEIFVRFCRVNGSLDELRRLDFAGFARVYNGANYRDFNYDGQMRGYYKGLKAKNINCAQLIAGIQAAEKIILTDVKKDPTLQAAGNVSHSETAISAPMSVANVADQLKEAVATDGADFTQTKIKTDTVEMIASSNSAAELVSAKNFEAFIPQIDTAKSYLKRLFSGSVLAAVGAFWFGLPEWMQISLAVLVLVIVVGGIVIFVRYYKDIFAFATAMNTLRATKGVDNPILTIPGKNRVNR